MYKRMLIPVDGSELSQATFVYAKELAARLDLDLTFLHVCSPDKREMLPMHRAYVERVAETVRRQSEEVQEKAGIEPGGKAVAAHGELAVGYPAEEIVRYTDENNIDLILMATHGRSGIGRWAYGSVAEKVVAGVSSPFLLVRPQ